MSKMCKFDSSKRCYHSSCSWYDGGRNRVVLCSLFRGGDFHIPRIVEHDLECRSIYR